MNLKNTTLLLVTACMGLASRAQVTVTNSNYPMQGMELVMISDTTTIGTPAAEGANKTWDFTALKSHVQQSNFYSNPLWVKNNNFYPTANSVLISSDADKTRTFMNISSSKASVLGSIITYLGKDYLTFDQYTIANYPMTYNSKYTYTNSYGFANIFIGLDIDQGGPLPFIDSLRVNYFQDNIDEGKGWGSLKLPGTTYNSILVKSTAINYVTSKIKTGGSWITTPAAVAAIFDLNSKDTTLSHKFMSSDAGAGLFVLTYNIQNNKIDTGSVNWQFKKVSIGATNLHNLNTVNINPNPAKDIITLDVENSNFKVIKIYNSQGLLIQQLPFSTKINISNLPVGLYYLQLENTNSKYNIQSQKFSVIR